MSPSARDREMANHLKQVAWEIGIANDGRDAADEIAAALAQARAEEREACANLVNEYASRPWWEAAAAIRARGEDGE